MAVAIAFTAIVVDVFCKGSNSIIYADCFSRLAQITFYKSALPFWNGMACLLLECDYRLEENSG
ncbi:MAG TPA: hypothetical protein ENJ82_11035 [Bacteroidetes bacterium]|nr:hypothetical protein [Bacteroidota bacterium]